MNLTGQVAERYVLDAMALDPVSATLAGIFAPALFPTYIDTLASTYVEFCRDVGS
jgi:hypothetical protein